MAVNGFTNMVTDGLVLNLDAANLKSYPTTGSTWFDLTKRTNGTLTNFGSQVTWNSIGNGSIVFDGSNDFVSITSNLAGLTSLTIQAWVYIRAYHPSNTVVFSWPISNTSAIDPFTISSIAVDASTGVLTATVGNGSTRVIFTSNQAMTLNAWHSVGLLWNGSVLRTTLNGVISSTSASAVYAALGNSSANLYLGGYNTNNIYWLDGYLSNFQIYNRALSSEEIQQNYNATKWRFI